MSQPKVHLLQENLPFPQRKQYIMKSTKGEEGSIRDSGNRRGRKEDEAPVATKLPQRRVQREVR